MKILNKKRVVSFALVIIALLLFIVVKSVNVQGIEKAVKTTKNHGGSSELITVKIDPNLIYTEELFNQLYGDLKDTDKILDLPRGGVLSHCWGGPHEGPDMIGTDENGKVTEYDIDTDPRSETIAEYKKRIVIQKTR